MTLRSRTWLATALTAAVWLLTSAAAALALIPPAQGAPALLTGPETRAWDFDFIDLEQRQCSQQVSRGPPSVTREHTYFVGESGVWVHNACTRDRVVTNIAESRKARVARNVAQSRAARKSSGFSDFSRRVDDNRVSPSDIRFSQPTISQNFSSNGNVNDLVEGLRSGRVSVDDVPSIRVTEFEGNLVTLDNRRLAAFQAAGVKKITVKRVSLSDQAVRKEFLRKNNPIGDGRFVVVTPDASGRKAAEMLLREAGKIN